MLHVAGEWAKGWILCEGLVSAPALWGQSYCFPSCSTAVFFPPEQGSGPPPGAPVLVLRFSYICPDRKLRRYAVLEPEAHEAIQVLDPEAGGKSGGSRSWTGGLGSPSSSTCSLPAHS